MYSMSKRSIRHIYYYSLNLTNATSVKTAIERQNNLLLLHHALDKVDLMWSVGSDIHR